MKINATTTTTTTTTTPHHQPFGWQSREFLRCLAVGQAVTFKVDYKVPAINRDFGTIVLTSTGESLNKVSSSSSSSSSRR